MSIKINFVDEEYSDASASNVYDWFNEVSPEFSKSNHFKALTDEQQEYALFMLHCFFEYGYSYCLTGPGKINEEVIDEVCQDVMPRKISEGKDAFESFGPSINQFLLWCENKEYIKNTLKLRQHLNKITPKMVELSQDSGNWGIAKSICMGGPLNIPKRIADHIPGVINTYQREERKVGRNEPCPCGSNKKYKKCCMLKIVN